MESVFSYWKESFSLFGKDNLKTFLLGSLKTYLRVLVFIAGQQWLIFPWMVMHALGNMLLRISPHFILATQLVDLILLYVIIMTLRQAVEAKDRDYYLKYATGFWALGLAAFMNVFAFFPLLFFFDSTMSFKDLIPSIRRSILAFIHFTPMLVLLQSLLAGAWWCTNTCNEILMRTAMNGTHVYVYTLLFAFSAAAMLSCFSALTVYYIKIKHEHFDLLFT